ncbi:hypothetical protein Calab_1522 [Caldithrix abyssi DSM 13497]|uniref:Uncharacterized protein n=1 Tax=Caldithrix abyssi DSM 13497 TaxID=880073 RepID=H1XTE3_CALAY|nr:hypothetical protein [Caldithrix abyssi]APF16985.1 hypothetical protein Cabys_234 [Caldithrix abyssi DSM 13497]APF20326.1 hypothetical protein Cabys_3580 [Caldithrix abyssi DSM 13497]EHO40376.1 hypothetical protein Calab_0737 [Caldithrix abyssi DSM 13497]EHO41142.1 hypothetical protein Calab_1522 [Caldithrix abyssi DSM 13497]
MLTFKNLALQLQDYLKNKMPDVNIELGKYGQMPAILPAIWIFLEPGPVKRLSTNATKDLTRLAKVYLFSFKANAENPASAAIDSMELLMQAETHLIQFRDDLNNGQISQDDNQATALYFEESSIAFDAVYSDISVSVLECFFSYVKL